jgi:type I restriction enzyme S subunit
MNQGATQPNLNTDIVRKMQIALPRIGDQLKIVDFLKAHVLKVSESIHLHTQQIAKLKEYRTVLIDAAVTGKIRI